MDVRRLLRGSLDWEQLEGVSREIARRLDREEVHITFLETDNWSSIPFVVDDDYFVKVITPQNALVHALLTGARNLGAITSGSQGFFDRFDSPYEMAAHEMAAIERIRALGLNAPEPIECFEYDGLAVIAMEYLPSFTTLGDRTLADEEALVEALFSQLALMHDHDVVHGDLRANNILVHDGELYVIDATLVRESWREEAMAYDLASAIAIVSPGLGPKRAVQLARNHFTSSQLLEARRFLDFVRVRPDHEFDLVQLRGELDSHVA